MGVLKEFCPKLQEAINDGLKHELSNLTVDGRNTHRRCGECGVDVFVANQERKAGYEDRLQVLLQIDNEEMFERCKYRVPVGLSTEPKTQS